MLENNIEKKEIEHLIACIPIFKNLENHEGLVDFISRLKKQEIVKGTILFKEGEVGNEACVLLDCSVEVRKRSLLSDDIVVAVVKASQKKHEYKVVGECSFCAKTIRSATITSLSDILTFKITKTLFNNLCERFPEVGLNVYKNLCDIQLERLQVANNNVIELFNAFVDEIKSEQELNYYSSMIGNLTSSDGIES